jgi:D-amino-acid dehydrogenase
VRVIVIGGGVIGTASAHYLADRGCHVTLIDKGSHGGGCSHGNCGYVCPSHVFPLTTPGAINDALRSLLKRNAPFRVKRRIDPGLWYWLYKFARRCNFDCMMQAAVGIQNLLVSSMTEYERLVEREGLQCEWEKKGLLYVYRSRERYEGFAKTNVILRDRFNEPAAQIDADTLQSMEPALKPGMAGAWYYEQDAHVRPDRLMSSWRAMLQLRGVEVRENCELHGFVSRNGKAAAAATSQGEIEGDHFVVATGSWTPFLKKHLGCKVPIQPGKGYSMTMPRPQICPKYPIIFPETRVAVTPWQSGYRLGSTMEFAGWDPTVHPARLQLLRDGSRDYLQEPYCEPVLETWCGWRPMTWDSLPIIDRTPRFANVTIAAGHNMVGISMGPGTGKLVAEIVTGAQPHIDPQPYSVSRF